MYSWWKPHSRAKASASFLWDSGMEAESAVTARAFSPSTRCAAHARYAESAPPEYAMMTRRIGFRIENSLSCFAFRIPKSSFGAAASLTKRHNTSIARPGNGVLRLHYQEVVLSSFYGGDSALQHARRNQRNPLDVR